MVAAMVGRNSTSNFVSSVMLFCNVFSNFASSDYFLDNAKFVISVTPDTIYVDIFVVDLIYS